MVHADFIDYFLLPGHIYISQEPSIVSTVLGSCVAVSLWSTKQQIGAMAHYLLPTTNIREQATARYGNVAMGHLIRTFLSENRAAHLQAQIFGGAALDDPECREIAEGNIRVARTALRRHRIKIVSEDTGGNLGRKVVYNTLKNEAIVYKVHNLRRGDWYPYSQEDR